MNVQNVLKTYIIKCVSYLKRGGGGGGMSIFEYSPRKWPKSHTQKIFLSNGKIVYYQDVPQLQVPLNTQHTIHLNAKSHDLL